MSLITTTPRQIATRDILCYKLIYTDRSRTYWLGGSAGGRTNKEVFDFNIPVMAKGVKQVTNDRGRFCVDRGFFHSYINSSEANSFYKPLDGGDFYRIYAYAVVPKGTNYYINNSEIASDYLIVFSSKLEYFKYKLKSLLGGNNSI